MKKALLVFLTAGVVLPLVPRAAQGPRKPAPKASVRSPARPVAHPGYRPAGRATGLPTNESPAAPRPAVGPDPAPPAPKSAAPRPAGAGSPGGTPSPLSGAGAPFEAGANVFNLGLGLGSRYGYGAGLLGGSRSVAPAWSLSYERGLLALGPGVVGAGVFAGYQAARYDFGGGDQWRYTDVVVTLRGAFHWPVRPQLDAYGGLGLGLRHALVFFERSSFLGTEAARANELTAGLFVGGRYFFTPRMGAFAELGYDQTYLKIGLTAKL